MARKRKKDDYPATLYVTREPGYDDDSPHQYEATVDPDHVARVGETVRVAVYHLSGYAEVTVESKVSPAE